MLIPDKKKRAATIIASIKPRDPDVAEETSMEQDGERYGEDTRMAVFAMVEKILRQIEQKDVEGLAQTLRDLHDMHHIEPTPELVEAEKESVGVE